MVNTAFTHQHGNNNRMPPKMWPVISYCAKFFKNRAMMMIMIKEGATTPSVAQIPSAACLSTPKGSYIYGSGPGRALRQGKNSLPAPLPVHQFLRWQKLNLHKAPAWITAAEGKCADFKESGKQLKQFFHCQIIPKCSNTSRFVP